MSGESPAVGVALLVQGTGPGVLASLTAFANTIEALEARGASVPVALVEHTDDAEAAAVVTRTEGAVVLRHARHERDARALAHGVSALPPNVEYVLLGATDAGPVRNALASIVVRAVATRADLVLADSKDPAPYAIAQRSVARRLLPGSDPTLPPVLALARAARSAGAAITTATGVGQQRIQSTPRELSSTLRGVNVGVIDPKAVRVGTCTYFAPGCSLRTWGPEERIEIGAYCSFADDIAILHPGSPPRDREGRHVIVPIRGAHHMQSASTYPMSTYAVVVGNPQQVTRRRFNDEAADSSRSRGGRGILS